jgi:two-component system, chemotaxis family, protein-glutamate methylesterase/glutaminase
MISVLVVDDSAVIRRLITEVLATDPQITIVGTAPNGAIALEKIEQLKPDLVTLDIEMPVLDGLSTLRRLRPKWPRLPVIMFSTLTVGGGTATLNALAAGASDYVTKPSNVGSFAESRASVQRELLPRIHALAARRRPTAGAPGLVRPGAGAADGTGPGAVRAPAGQRGRIMVCAIGCSTGGPDAMTKLVAGFPGGLPVPIVVVQHMPALFTRLFAERLNRMTQLTVVEAEDGQPVTPGRMYIAPGGRHLEVVRRGVSVLTKLHDGPPENHCRPAVDVLFRSVASVYGKEAIALVLTGMGHDGKEGARAMRAAGAEIAVQDEDSSVVWGMPGAIAQAGLADAVLRIPELAAHVVARASAGHSTRPVAVTR